MGISIRIFERQHGVTPIICKIYSHLTSLKEKKFNETTALKAKVIKFQFH